LDKKDTKTPKSVGQMSGHFPFRDDAEDEGYQVD
jgi:hypothetical protein